MVARLFKKKSTEEPKKAEEQKQSAEPSLKEVKPADSTQSKAGGLSEKINELNEKIDVLANISKEKTKSKQFKVPWKIRRQLKVLAKKNKVLVFYLRSNRNIVPITTSIKDGLIKIEDKYYQCDLPFVYLWLGKFPAIVLPEFSMNPIGTNEYYKAMENKEGGVYSQTTFIRALEKAQEEQQKKKLKFGWVMLVLIGVGIMVYIFFFNKKTP